MIILNLVIAALKKKVMLWFATFKHQLELMEALIKAYNVAHKDTVKEIWISRLLESLNRCACKVKEISCFKRDFQHQCFGIWKRYTCTYTLYKKIKKFLKDMKSKTPANNDFVVVKVDKLGNMIFKILIIYFSILRLIKNYLDKIYC